MKHVPRALVLLLLLGCGGFGGSAENTPNGADAKASLSEARRGFQTKLARRESADEPLPQPPAGVFRVVRYDAAPGKLAAYLTPAPKDGKRHPAIVWITGGDCNTIDDGLWKPAAPQNDQTASAFRKAGIVMMCPTLRGGNDNPGVREGLFGEVDDVLAAADYLAKQDYVDPARIYLGGHSTGGTLVFLTAESSDRFRAVFSFGPVDNVRGYSGEYLPFDTSNRREFELRCPARWLHSVRSPLFAFEGTVRGNVECLHSMSRLPHGDLVHLYPVEGVDHVSILAPVTRLIAEKILRDDGPATNVTFTDDELRKAVGR